MNLEDAEPKMRVKYIPQNENGTVTSKNDTYIFVKFDDPVSRLGWEGTTSQACSPCNLEAL